LEIKSYFELANYDQARESLSEFSNYKSSESLKNEILGYIIKIDEKLEEEKRQIELEKKQKGNEKNRIIKLLPTSLKNAAPFQNGISFTDIDNVRYMINTAGQVLYKLNKVPREYFRGWHGFNDEISVPKEGIIAVNLNYNELVFIDTLGTILSSHKGKNILSKGFSNGYAVIQSESNVKIINTLGEITMESSSIDRIRKFTKNGLAVYDNKENGLDGCIRPNGDIIISAKYDFLGDFHDNLAIVGVNAGAKDNYGYSIYHYGIINIKGEYVLKPMIHDSGQRVNIDYLGDGMFLIRVQLKKLGLEWAIFDANEKKQAPLVFNKLNHSGDSFINNYKYNPENVFIAYLSPNSDSRYDQNFQLIRYDGTRVSKDNLDRHEYEYEKIYGFINGISGVMKDKKVGFINSKGELILHAVFDNSHNFHEGYAWVLYKEKWICINREGRIVIQYKNLTPSSGRFSDGLSKVKINGKSYFINTSGEVILGEKNQIFESYYLTEQFNVSR